jgi:hypothetical protein
MELPFIDRNIRAEHDDTYPTACFQARWPGPVIADSNERNPLASASPHPPAATKIRDYFAAWKRVEVASA